MTQAFDSGVKKALDDDRLQAALNYVTGPTGFPAKRLRGMDSLPEYEDLKLEGQAIRNHTIANLDAYLERFEENVLKAGGQVHWASTPEQARDIVAEICQDAKIVTKGKSMITEEIDLNHHLEGKGIEVVETDLGEYIVQLRKERPSHIIAPAIHLDRHQVADTFREHHTDLEQDRDLTEPTTLLVEAREKLREKFLSADVGITGANFLVAETGTALIVTNEGNGDLTQSLPPVHIAVTSIDKVVPTLEDATTLLRVLARTATGQQMSVYTTFFSGSKRDDDLDGPREFHVVLLDNGRSNLIDTPQQDILRCIRCGICLGHCPVYASIGGHAYGSVYPGPIGAALSPALHGVGDCQDMPHASSLCGRCGEVCPMGIPLPDLLRRWREKSPVSPLIKAWAALARRPKLYRPLMRMGVWAAGLLGLAPVKPQGGSFMEQWEQQKADQEKKS